MPTANVITALVYDDRAINERKESQLAKLPAGTVQLDAVVVTSEGLARNPNFAAWVNIVGTGSSNGTGVTTRSQSGKSEGQPDWLPPKKAGGAYGEIVASIGEVWQIEWNPDADTPWGNGAQSGIQVRPVDNLLWAGVDLTIIECPGGRASAAVIMIARDLAGETLAWPGEWRARAS